MNRNVSTAVLQCACCKQLVPIAIDKHGKRLAERCFPCRMGCSSSKPCKRVQESLL